MSPFLCETHFIQLLLLFSFIIYILLVDQIVIHGICTLSRKITTFRQFENIIVLL